MPRTIPAPSSADETLGFLVSDAARAFRRAFVPMIARHGVAIGHFPFLRIIAERGGLTLRELADAVHLRGPTTVQAVKEMERRGLVRRERDPRDARKVRLHLTPAGKRAWASVIPAVAAINDRALRGLSSRETGQLKRLLRRVRKELESPA